MASLPSQHPSLSLHLSDVTLTPLITSAASQSHLESLTQLTSSALSSQTAVLRLGLGRPTRLMVEYPDRGPVVLHSYLDPRDAAAAASAEGPPASAAPGNGNGTAHPGTTPPSTETAPSSAVDDPNRSEDAAPMLVGVVVAGSADDTKEARRAAARLERVGREFQREWVAETQGHEDGPE
ncbi:hypothetical protein B0T10DRAFT_554316 [Thelonectria olida]|uniref:Uncharacterized protein n=1 Tax=Thelonectria olida TaxID=1576542 RepID=A0A9P8WL29_9HYPO|nr:hypothetical protein B0T10DRAFT_554316 [Thelonectria olida]